MRVRSFISNRPSKIIKISTRIGQKRVIHEFTVECHHAQNTLNSRDTLKFVVLSDLISVLTFILMQINVAISLGWYDRKIEIIKMRKGARDVER